MIVLLLKNTFQRVMLKYVPWNWLVYIEPRFLKLTPDDLKTQEMCNEAIEKASWLLYDVPVHIRTYEMCNTAVEKCLHPLRFIPDHLKTREMWIKAVEKISHQLVISLIILKRKRCATKQGAENQKP